MKQVQRILLLKMDHIGDALWSFPTIAALRQTCPDAWIGMLCTPYLAEVYRNSPHLSAVVEYDSHAPLSERMATLREVRRTRPDLAIVLGPVDKINHLAWLSGANERRGYAYAGNPLHALTRRLFLTDCRPHPADLALAAGKPLPHEVPAMLALLGLDGVQPTPCLHFPVTDAQKKQAANELAVLLPGKQRFAAVHLCAKSFPFGWSEQFVGELVEQLRQLQPAVGWLVTAGPSEQPHLAPYRQRFANQSVPLAEGLSLQSMAALLSNLDCLVSWDTGVVHLATAVGIPAVDLFPAKDFDYCVQRWGPWGVNAVPLPQQEPQASVQTLSAIAAAVSPILQPVLETQQSLSNGG